MVSIGDVTTWDTGCTPREQAKKILEEAAEVFAILDQHGMDPGTCNDVLRECADVVTATANLVEVAVLLGYSHASWHALRDMCQRWFETIDSLGWERAIEGMGDAT